MIPTSSLTLLDPSLEILSFVIDKGKIKITVANKRHSVICPTCLKPSSKRHSRYQRKIQDIPMEQKEVEIILLARKWFCLSPSCSTHIFTERYSWISSKKRRTKRADDLLRKLAFSSSCLTAEKLSRHLGLPVSHDTLLNLIHQTPDSPEVSPFCRH
ncbi:transposase family protein [Fictibacillus sp. NRS-1165]|uniref:transposase family protein n=1 Tax=Fictibacillus sp. NRS-1165 TaxID=3144463 RepID=UPI003D1E13A3